MRNLFLHGITVTLFLTLVIMGLTPLFAQDAPSIQLVQPQQNDVITNNKIPVKVQFHCSTDAPIVRMDVYLDSALILPGRVRNPLAVGELARDIDVADLKPNIGTHILCVKLYDSTGGVTERDVTLTFQQLNSGPGHIPSVRIVNPQDGATITTRTNIRVEATADAGIHWVMFYINGKMRAMMNQEPYVLPWDPIKDRLASGSYVLSARALDLFDNVGFSAPITVNVLNTLAGRTPLEQGGIASASANDVPGVFPVTLAAVPSGGPGMPRRFFANPTSPMLNWSSDVNLPLISAVSTLPRSYQLPVADGGLLVIVPTKSLPGHQEMANASALASRGVTEAPALAALLGPVAPVALTNEGAIPVHIDVPVAAMHTTATTPAEHAKPASAIQQNIALVTPDKIAPQQTAMTDMRVASLPVIAVVAVVPAPTVATSGMPAMAVTENHAMAPITMTAAIPALNTAANPSERVTPATVIAVAQTGTVAPEKIAPAHMMPADAGTAPRIFATTAAQSPIPAGVQIASAKLPPATIQQSATIRETPAVAPASTTPVTTTAKASLPEKVMLIASACTPSTKATAPQAAAKPVYLAQAVSPAPRQAASPAKPVTTVKHPQMATKPVQAVTDFNSHIYLQAKPIANAPDPYSDHGYTMVPFRAIIESSGGKVSWSQKKNEANAKVNQVYLIVAVGSTNAQIDKLAYKLPIAAQLRQSRVMVPVDYALKALDMKMVYNPDTGVYYLMTNSR